MSKPSPSIRRRLIGQLLIVFAIFVVAAYWVTRTIALNNLQNAQDQALLSVAQVIADSVVASPGDVLFELPYPAFDVLSYQAPESIYYQIKQGSEVLAGYENLPRIIGDRATQTYIDQSVRFVQLQKPLTAPQMPVTITLGQTQDSLRYTVNSLAIRSALYAIAGFLLIAAAAYAGVINSLLPLRRIEKNLKNRNPEDFSPMTDSVPREIETLVDSLNQSMAQHKALLDQTRQLIAQSTHQIKTPIASLSAEADLLLDRVPADVRDDVSNLAVHARQTSRLVSQLLTHASLTYRKGSERLRPVDVVVLARQVLDSFEIVAEQAEVELSLHGPASLVHTIDPIGVREALVCLVDNAIKYGGRLGEVSVTLSRETGLLIRVEDSGDGFKGDPEHLTQEFYTQHPAAGAGLGLSIAKQVAVAGAGHLKLYNSPTQGARCDFYLP